MVKKEKPQIDFIIILHKIKDLYQNYENIFYNEIEGLKDDFDSSMLKHRIEWKRFWYGLIVGHRCHHAWVPRNISEIPEICPKCKSPYWKKAKTRFTKNDKKKLNSKKKKESKK